MFGALDKHNGKVRKGGKIWCLGQDAEINWWVGSLILPCHVHITNLLIANNFDAFYKGRTVTRRCIGKSQQNLHKD